MSSTIYPVVLGDFNAACSCDHTGLEAGHLRAFLLDRQKGVYLTDPVLLWDTFGYEILKAV